MELIFGFKALYNCTVSRFTNFMFYLVLCCARATVGGKDILTGVCVTYYYRHHGFVPEQQQ